MSDEFTERYKKFHRRVSFVKSAVRIVGCLLALAVKDALWAVALLLVAEVFGVVEEFI